MIRRCRLLPLTAIMLVTVMGVTNTTASTSRRTDVGIITGQVRSATTRAPLPDVVVTVRSPKIVGEEIIVTDKNGQFCLPSVPPDDSYTVEFDGGGQFKPLLRRGIHLMSGAMALVNADLTPEPPSSGCTYPGPVSP